MKYVEKRTGLHLDYTAETLPVLDHYLREARASCAQHPETGVLLCAVTGCYLGEVLRRRHLSLDWHTDADDPLEWELRRREGSLSVLPAAIAKAALRSPGASDNDAFVQLPPGARRALAQKLGALPEVSDEEFVAPSTRIEVVDFAMEMLATDKPESPS